MGLPAVLLALGALVGCTPHRGAGPASSTAPPPTSTTTAVTTPPAPVPAATTSCPYLSIGVVQNANGQHVGKVRISAAHSGTPPSCFFYRYDDRLQVAVRIYRASTAQARTVVNAAAPVATSDKAQEPAGWQGGSQPTKTGAVYAVAKGGTAVVVTTNQAQTIKAKVLAVDAIKALKL